MTDELRDYEIRVRRLGRFQWQWMVLLNGSGQSGPEHVTRTRWGAIRKARARIERASPRHLPWERVESGLYGLPEDEPRVEAGPEET